MLSQHNIISFHMSCIFKVYVYSNFTYYGTPLDEKCCMYGKCFLFSLGENCTYFFFGSCKVLSLGGDRGYAGVKIRLTTKHLPSQNVQ